MLADDLLDLRARTVDGSTVSYVLPRSLNELLKLDHGRRKAYEVRVMFLSISYFSHILWIHSGDMHYPFEPPS